MGQGASQCNYRIVHPEITQAERLRDVIDKIEHTMSERSSILGVKPSNLAFRRLQNAILNQKIHITAKQLQIAIKKNEIIYRTFLYLLIQK